MRTVERSRDRRALAKEAGLRSTSFVSVLAGVLVAYGAVLVLLSVAAGIGSALGVETSGISDNEWRNLGVGAAVALGVVLFASYFFGGYVAGRMGRRAGVVHGLLVFLLGLVVIAAVAAITSASADGDAISDELQNQGIPTAWDDWREIGVFAGIGVLAAMLLGALAGGAKGERWHGVLVTRALDPEVRPRGESPSPADTRDGAARDADERHDDTMTIPPRGTGDATEATPGATRDEGTSSAGREHHDDEVTVDLTDAEREEAARRQVEEERERITRMR